MTSRQSSSRFSIVALLSRFVLVLMALVLMVLVGCRSRDVDSLVAVQGTIQQPLDGDVTSDDLFVRIHLDQIDPSQIEAVLVQVFFQQAKVKESEVPFTPAGDRVIEVRLPVADLEDGKRYRFTLSLLLIDGNRHRVTPDMDIRFALGLTTPTVSEESVETFDPRHTFQWEYDEPAVGDRISFALTGIPDENALYSVRVGTESDSVTPDTNLLSRDDIATGRETKWRVRMVSARGVLGPPSAYGLVTFTESLPPIETLTGSLGMPSVVALPGLVWKPQPGAVKYYLEITGGDGVESDRNALRPVTTRSRYRITAEELEILLQRSESNGGDAPTITWRVSAENALGNVSAPSGPFSFVYDYRMASMETVLPGRNDLYDMGVEGTGSAPLALVVLGARRAEETDESPLLEVGLTRGYTMAKYETTTSVVAGAMNSALARGRAAIIEEEGGGRFIVDPVYGYPLVALDELSFGTQFSLSLTAGEMLEPVDGYRSHPAVGITWYGAVFLANELSLLEARDQVYEFSVNGVAIHPDRNGYRLPTEGEWAFAAALERRVHAGREGVDGVAGPRTPILVTEDRPVRPIEFLGINYQRSGHRWEDLSPPYTRAGGPTTPVGALGYVNGAGLADMLGNVWEWTADWYDPQWYARASLNGSTADGGPETAVPDIYGRELKVVRGTAWNTPRESVRVTNRGAFSPDASSHSIGLRFVRTLEATDGDTAETTAQPRETDTTR